MNKYLATYSEKETAQAKTRVGAWDEVVVIPLYAEHDLVDGCLDALAIASEGLKRGTLAIVVVNGRENSTETEKQSNVETLNRLRPRWSDKLEIWAIDRATAGNWFPEKEGVGLARKLGCDLALALHAEQRITSNLIHTTDGDARPTRNYFDVDVKGEGAYLHDFEHVGDPLPTSLRWYDRYLHYHVDGLQRAKSPYAYHAIGSTIAITPKTYAAVRGFPKVQAGEDFYLLNKVAKVAAVHSGGGEVKLLSRESLRVPFGTGKSMDTIDKLIAKGEPYTVYHPKVYDELAKIVEGLNDFAEVCDLERLKRKIDLGGAWLEHIGFFKMAEESISGRRSVSDRRRHLHGWFDAFRTLKWIHFLREKHYPSVVFGD